MLATYANLALAVMKWPAALISLALLPCAALEGLSVVGASLHPSEPVLGFVGGLLTYALLDWSLFRRRFMGSSFSTLEHELTHAIWASGPSQWRTSLLGDHGPDVTACFWRHVEHVE